MPLDAICLQAVVNEISPALLGSRIEKIQQPARDQLVLLLRGNRRLFLCANPNQPRIHMTEQLRDNPSQPPMFCMLLRKHIGNGRIVAVEQSPLERVVTLAIEATDEMGEQSRFSLILEAMGRNTNLILTDKDNRIVDCLRRVDLEMSQVRQVLPGLFYELPPKQEKCDPLTVTEDAFFRLLRDGESAEQQLTAKFTAISPLIAREIVYAAHGDSDSTEVDDRLWCSFSQWQEIVKSKNFTPNVLLRQGKPFDFTYQSIAQYGSYGESVPQGSFSTLLDTFYSRREQAERVKQRGQELVKAATNARDRVRRKIALREKEYAQTQDRETLRIRGELITANLYRMERGQRVLEAQNYYEEDCPTVEIPLDVRLSPQENAAKYFKQYNKAKTAEKMLTELITSGREELQYLESVLQELQLAESEQDFMDIRAELEAGGYLRKQGKKGGSFQRPSKPREFRSTAGLRILVGRNNRQNDRLTTKDAQKWDVWLHTQKIHGSHVILCTDGAEPDEQSILEAAQIAAYFSQGREGDKVAVDYTPVKFVKKPAASRPGMVIYTTYKTMYVTPDEELVKRLSVK
ncbi:MAG: NFACT family protein [Oscillospiraceae bacterium]|nr:NFACT family protein [Oscillospiraceae bacterium]